MIKKQLPFLLLFFTLQCLFLLLQIRFQNYTLKDSSEYIQASDNFIREGTIYFGDLSGPEEILLYTKRPPGYPVFLSLSRIFTENPLPVLILQSFLSLLSALIIILIFGRKSGLTWFFAVFILFMPAQFIYPNLIMAETLFQFLLMFAGLMLFSFIHTLNNKFLWFYQALVCIGILVKPVLFWFVFVNLLFFMYLYYRHNNRLVLISGMIPLVFVIIFSSINQQKTGIFRVSGIQQENRVDKTLYSFLLQQEGEAGAGETTDSITRICKGEQNYRKYSRCLNRETTKIIYEKLPEYGWFHAKGMLRFFIDPGRFDICSFFGLQKNGEKGLGYWLLSGGEKAAWSYLKEQSTFLRVWIISIAFFNLLKLTGFFFFLFNRETPRDFRIFLLLIIGTLAFATGPLGASRYALPVGLFILGGAAVQYHHWYMKLFAGKKR